MQTLTYLNIPNAQGIPICIHYAPGPILNLSETEATKTSSVYNFILSHRGAAMMLYITYQAATAELRAAGTGQLAPHRRESCEILA